VFWGLKNINLNALFYLKFICEASNHDRAVSTALQAHATTETFGESAETAPSDLESEFMSSPA